jgi:molybdopterin molybdotransferase
VIAVDEALRRVLAEVRPLGVEIVAVAEAHGRVLARDALADLDQPAFDRVMMDGIAVRSQDCAAPGAELVQVGEAPAGRPFAGTVGAGQCARAMTGAVRPDGADAVVIVERIEAAGIESPSDDHTARPRWRVLDSVNPGQHIALRGCEVACGAVVVPAGRRLGPGDVGVLASFGQAQVAVYRRPKVAVLPTGDEVVPVEAVPQPGQVRDANRHALTGVLVAAGCEVVQLPVARDDASALQAALRDAVRGCDAVVLSGGVSAGDYDLVPPALQELGATTHVRQIRIKPGKPFLFATLPDPDGGAPKLVFGLPGNPVSSLVCCTLLAMPALLRLQGIGEVGWRELTLPAGAPVSPGGTRFEVLPARIEPEGTVVALPVRGSADLAHFAQGDAWLLRPENAPAAAIGDPVRVLWWPRPAA